MALIDILQKQYAHSWRMLADGIESCSDAQWKAVIDDPFFVPARVAFHVIQTIDFYTSPTADEFDWKAFGFDWEEAPAEDLPARAKVSGYLDTIREKLDTLLSSMDETALMDSDSEFAPYFSSPFERLNYGLRHSHHHIGQMSLDLQRRGLSEIEW
jgi:uncharacterized damage-inducible protein DinB